ncbi:DUF397 domain-containing protein [Streptomyces odontomachi]|uniref:DUF397 domain-containing protein n=1 Tax=Streptomyces odontomachi TaxID=2944940 RepID=UPI00210DF82C|nr:DUF397 domain-containing protein [Streptomyces sp. ODS25]
MEIDNGWQKSTFSGGTSGQNRLELTASWQKSTFSGGGSGDNCLELAATWKKSSFSDGNSSGDCLEIATSATTATHIHLRESDSPATVLTAPPATLRALLVTLKAGAPAGTAEAGAPGARP